MKEPTPIERLFEIRSAVIVAGSQDLFSWLEEGFQAFLQGGAATLDEAMGLRSGEAGKRSWRTRYLMERRDEFLRTAHAHCEGSSAWEKACNLEKIIHRFQGIIWPRWRDMDEPPPSSDSKVYDNLFYAFRLGLKVPEGVRQLHEIATKGVYSLRKKR